jgi:hypothetical protein
MVDITLSANHEYLCSHEPEEMLEMLEMFILTENWAASKPFFQKTSLGTFSDRYIFKIQQ